MYRLEIAAMLIALTYVVFLARLVRRGQLREKYILLWVGVGIAVVVLSVTRRVTDDLAGAIGIAYSPSILFVVAIVFLLAVVTHLSWEISRLEERTRRLAEEIALMRPERAEPQADLTDGAPLPRAMPTAQLSRQA